MPTWELKQSTLGEEVQGFLDVFAVFGLHKDEGVNGQMILQKGLERGFHQWMVPPAKPDDLGPILGTPLTSTDAPWYARASPPLHTKHNKFLKYILLEIECWCEPRALRSWATAVLTVGLALTLGLCFLMRRGVM